MNNNFLKNHSVQSQFSKDKIHKFIEVGAGNLGKALLHYPGFSKSGIKIIAAFDINPAKYDRDAEIPVLPIEELHDFIKNNNVISTKGN